MRLRILTPIKEQIPAEQRVRLQRRLRRLSRPVWPGVLRRTTPLSDTWGYDRGTPIDRYYIERFLADHRADITGRVLEVKDSSYTERFGSAVQYFDVLDLDPENPRATIVADLTAAHDVATDQFDCFLLTQTLQLIYDMRSALIHAHRILRPGGVLLVTVPTISRIVPRYGLGTDYWRFTPASCSRLFGEIFGPDNIRVQSYGNVLAAVGFLAGMAREELSSNELEQHDEYFPLITAVRAVKQGENQDKY